MIRLIIRLFIYMVVADSILSYFPNLKHNPAVKNLRKIVSYALDPIRERLPKEMSYDISPLILIGILWLIKVLW